MSYDFTTSANKAFGNNLVLKGGRYAIYNGDANQDDIVNVIDLGMVYNDALNLVSGYVNTDVTGDNFVDVLDISLVYNNSVSSVSVIRP